MPVDNDLQETKAPETAQDRMARLREIKRRKQQELSDQATGLKAKLEQFPGLVRMMITAGGAVAAIATVSILFKFGGSLLDNKPEAIGKPVQLRADLVAPNQAEQQTPLELEGQRQQAWQSVRDANQGLTSSVTDFETQLRFARAQKWQLFANQKCQDEGAKQCPSSYSWLLNAYRDQAARVQRLMFAGRVNTDADTVDKFRTERDRLLDIGAAISLEISGTAPRPFIPTAELSNSIETLYEKGGEFESLRQAIAAKAYEQSQQQQGGQQR